MSDNQVLQSMTDEELAGLSGTSVEAEAELLARYFRLVRFHAGRYAATPTDAEDLTQEGLITLLHVMKKFEPSQGAFSAFAQVCIINRMRSLVRQEQHRAEPAEDLLRKLEESGALIDPDTPESILMEKENYVQCRMQIMALLSEKEWTILQTVLEGNTYMQTAEKLGITVKSVDNTMQRIRRKMRTSGRPDDG